MRTIFTKIENKLLMGITFQMKMQYPYKILLGRLKSQGENQKNQ